MSAAAASDLGDVSPASAHGSSSPSAVRYALSVLVALLLLAVLLTPRVPFFRRIPED